MVKAASDDGHYTQDDLFAIAISRPIFSLPVCAFSGFSKIVLVAGATGNDCENENENEWDMMMMMMVNGHEHSGCNTPNALASGN